MAAFPSGWFEAMTHPVPGQIIPFNDEKERALLSGIYDVQAGRRGRDPMISFCEGWASR